MRNKHPGRNQGVDFESRVSHWGGIQSNFYTYQVMKRHAKNVIIPRKKVTQIAPELPKGIYLAQLAHCTLQKATKNQDF